MTSSSIPSVFPHGVAPHGVAPHGLATRGLATNDPATPTLIECAANEVLSGTASVFVVTRPLFPRLSIVNALNPKPNIRDALPGAFSGALSGALLSALPNASPDAV